MTMPSNRTRPRIQRLPATHLKLIERARSNRGNTVSISTCSEVLHHIRNQAGLEECESQLWSLKYHKWEEYRSSFYSNPGSCSYQASISPRAGLGRPKFLNSKDQLEYLSSLGFR